MKIIKSVFFGLFTLFFLSQCDEVERKDIKIVIQNDSHYNFDKIEISTTDAFQVFKNIPSGVKGMKDMAVPYLGTGSGNFLLKGFVNNRNIIRGKFGYYNKLGLIKSEYNIVITKDLTLEER